MASEENNTQEHEETVSSPKWNWPTKIVVGLALVAVSIWLLVQFQNFLGPIISAFILAYLLYPVTSFLRNKIKLPWRLAVGIIYVLLVLILLGLLTWGGLTLVEQIQNLIGFIENNINRLPELVEEITTRTYQIGPFNFSPTGFNWEQIANQIVNAIQPALGRLGSIVGSLAAGAANIFTWLAIIILISYFLLSESEGIRGKLLNIKIKDYEEDLDRMGKELNRIWNSFIRGEILILFLSLIVYLIFLGVLGLQFFYGLAVIAAIGQLVPYVGAWATWIAFGLVALLQVNPPFNLSSGIYMLIVLGVGTIINTLIDNIIKPKILSENLKVHPALILVGALIGVQLFGFIGIIVAAPIMASLQLFLHYTTKKLTDQEPWKDLDIREPTGELKWASQFNSIWEKIKKWFQNIFKRIKEWFNQLKTQIKNKKSGD